MRASGCAGIETVGVGAARSDTELSRRNARCVRWRLWRSFDSLGRNARARPGRRRAHGQDALPRAEPVEARFRWREAHANSMITASTARLSPGLALMAFTTPSRSARR